MRHMQSDVGTKYEGKEREKQRERETEKVRQER